MDKINPAIITINCSVDFRRKFIAECKNRGLSVNKAGIIAIKRFLGIPETYPKKEV